METVLDVASVVGHVLLGVAAIAAAVVVAWFLHRSADREGGWFDAMVDDQQALVWPWTRRMNTDLFTREQRIDYQTWSDRDRRGQRMIVRWILPPFIVVFGVLVATAAVVPAFR